MMDKVQKPRNYEFCDLYPGIWEEIFFPVLQTVKFTLMDWKGKIIVLSNSVLHTYIIIL
jgi:hypothetical protein